jgi:AcrR family transcriptional regulator
MSRVSTARGASTRELLIEHALDLFTRTGYEGTSVADVLSASGVSKGSLYHHFKDKQALFVAVLERVEDHLVQHIRLASAKASSPAQALRAGGDAFLRQAQDGAVRRVALLDAPAALGWRRWREVEERYGLGLIKASLRAATPDRPEGELDYDAHVLLATLIELGLLVAHASDADGATNRAQRSYDRLVTATLAG